MDKKGYDLINEAMKSWEIEAIITPKPQQGEDARYITIETAKIAPAIVLNALGQASLMHSDVLRIGVDTNPQLTSLAIQPGSLTFEDINAPAGPAWS